MQRDSFDEARKPFYSPYDQPTEHLYTEHNCKKRIEFFEQYLEHGVPKSTKDIINKLMDVYKKNMGKGYCIDENIDEFPFEGDSFVEKVVILTDELTASSGEMCAYYLSLLPKVAVIGRPTMGIQDYTDICQEVYQDTEEKSYYFAYPLCRLCALDKGEGVTRKGFPVDEYIPWTPEHLDKDVILERAISMFL